MTLPVANEKQREVALSWIVRFNEAIASTQASLDAETDDEEIMIQNIFLKSLRQQRDEIQEEIIKYDERSAYGEGNRTTNPE